MRSLKDIKFRAWIKRARQMSKPFTLLEAFGTLVDGELVLMQWTGLKDKNGREIFEGDVVRFAGDSRRGVVFYSERAGAFLINKTGDSTDASFGFAAYPGNDWRVVGNIYEHPELFGKESEIA